MMKPISHLSGGVEWVFMSEVQEERVQAGGKTWESSVNRQHLKS